VDRIDPEQPGVVRVQPGGVTPLADLAAALAGENVPITEALVTLAEAHAVDALLAASPAASHAPDALQARLKERRAAHALVSAARDIELARVLDALAANGLRPLVIKGGHLSHVLYDDPGLRPRADSDLWFDMSERAPAAAVLARLGYEPAVHVRGDLILGQWHFRRAEAGGLVHALDVHWRIAAPLVFRDALRMAPLRARARAIPPLGAAALGPAPADALAIACVHLIAHHRDAPQLLWLYEIDALTRALDDEAAASFVAMARVEGLVAVCAAALEMSRRAFGGAAVGQLLKRLSETGAAGEAPARILDASGPLGELWLDLRVCRGWHERATLVREHLYPDAEYVRARSGHAWLPLAYASRALGGATRWMFSGARDRTAAPAVPPAGSAAASRRPRSAKTTR
jgi:hypothetical protein